MMAAAEGHTAAERHDAETAELRLQLGTARDDVAHLHGQLAAAADRQAALVVELRRAAGQMSGAQMELEASRAVGAAQRETIAVRDAEIARLEARLGLLQRGLRQTVAGTAPDVNLATASVPPPLGEVATVDGGTDLQDAGFGLVPRQIGSSTTAGESVPLPSQGVIAAVDGDRMQPRVGLMDRGLQQSSGSIPGGSIPSQGTLEIGRLETRTRQSSGGTTPGRSVPPPGEVASIGRDADDGTGVSTGNPDSLLAIWHQLQLNDSTSQSSAAGGGDSMRRGGPRLGGALEEKARVQDRIKALIGYREPAAAATARRSTAAAAKPRLSVRPQPLNHTARSSATAAASTITLKQSRRPLAGSGDSANTSLHPSMAVSRYASSSADRLTTS